MQQTLSSALGVDTGGTFTDFVLISKGRMQTHKVLSTPDAPERAILQGIIEMNLAEAVARGELAIIHGSTVATNALLESKGVRTAYITNRGFKDTLTIARQTRPALYRLENPPLPEPVPEELCLEIGGRVDAKGQVLEQPQQEDLQRLLEQLELLKPEAIAINLLFSFLDDSHERLIEQTLREQLSWQPFICRSSVVLPEYKEYERGIATWLNASLGPLLKHYLLRLKQGTSPSRLSIMQSSGGTISAEQAANKAAMLLLSGPAGGLAAAAYLSKTLAIPNMMTFDMGGTSTDAALLDGGNIQLSHEGRIGPYPVAVPMVDMQTIGAGGGSIAYLDSGNLLRVGPRSAGASPGPACYGQGGTEATVTDANLVLGRLQVDAFMGGNIQLDVKAAQQAIGNIAIKLALTNETAAAGIISLANEHMAQALRAISVEKGYDPKLFRLCCFGGAGGLHICALADALGMTQALVPINAGVLSALGMLLAPVERNLSQNYQCLLEDADSAEITALFAKLKTQALRELIQEEVDPDDTLIEYSVDLRYQGQSSSLNLAWQDPASSSNDFHELHKQRYGYRLAAKAELVNLRIKVKSQQQAHELELLASKEPAKALRTQALYGFDEVLAVYEREQLAAKQIIEGPALILEKNSTTLIGTEWRARTDQFGHLFLDKQRA